MSSLIGAAVALATHRETLVAHWRVSRLRRAPAEKALELARELAATEVGREALEPLAFADAPGGNAEPAWNALLQVDFRDDGSDDEKPPPPPTPPERRLVGYVLHAASYDAEHAIAWGLAQLETVPPAVILTATRLALEGPEADACAGARALSRRSRDARIRPSLERIALESPFPRAQAIAVRAFVDVEKHETISLDVRRLVEREVDGASGPLREACAEALIALGPERDLVAVRLLDSRHEDVVQVAFEALARSAKPALGARALAHANPEVRRLAHAALPVHLGPTPELREGHRRGLEDPVEPVRLAAAHALARTGDGSGLAIAVAALRRGAPPELLVSAADCCHTLKATAAVPALVAVHDRSSDPAVQRATASALDVTTGRCEADERAPWGPWLAATPALRDGALDPEACFAITRRDGVAAVGSRAP